MEKVVSLKCTDIGPAFSEADAEFSLEVSTVALGSATENDWEPLTSYLVSTRPVVLSALSSGVLQGMLNSQQNINLFLDDSYVSWRIQAKCSLCALGSVFTAASGSFSSIV